MCSCNSPGGSSANDMLRLLLAKDFRRTFRNPWPWLLNLALPLAITAVIGLAFGGKGPSGGGDLPRVKIAVVDEDRSFIGSLVRSGLNQGEAAERLDPIFVGRAEALEKLRGNEISTVVAIPAGFTSQYLGGESGLKLEVIKNPSQAFMPAIIEELVAVAVTGLNGISRNFTAEFPALRAVFTSDWDLEDLGGAMSKIGERAKSARTMLDPPLVSYEKSVAASKTEGKGFLFSVFGYILPGMASAFLLFIADQAMRDFHREARMKTLDRQRIVGASAFQFIVGKTLFTALSVALAGAILFAGGSAIFGIEWGRPGLLALVVVCYALFAAGLMAALSAMAPTERRADALNSMLIFSMAFLGGSYLPADNLPAFMRERISPLMPNYWMIEAARALQDAGGNYLPPLLAVAKLAAVGIALAVAAGFILERRLTAGTRA